VQKVPRGAGANAANSALANALASACPDRAAGSLLADGVVAILLPPVHAPSPFSIVDSPTTDAAGGLMVGAAGSSRACGVP
jgi:hypothetical protein